MLNGWSFLLIIIILMVITSIIDKILLYKTTSNAIKKANMLGVTKDEILKQTVELVNSKTAEVQQLLLNKVNKIEDDVLKLVDIENKNVVLTVTKTEDKKVVKRKNKKDITE